MAPGDHTSSLSFATVAEKRVACFVVGGEPRLCFPQVGALVLCYWVYEPKFHVGYCIFEINSCFPVDILHMHAAKPAGTSYALLEYCTYKFNKLISCEPNKYLTLYL